MTISVYISGATGYIGGSVLGKLLKTKKFSFTALVRTQEKANVLEQKGIKTVIGTLQDSALIEEQVFKHDLTITTANVDCLEEAQAVVKGLKRKYKETGKPGILLQTSGSAIVIDPALADGNHANEFIYSDFDTASLSKLPANFPHRHVDTFLINQATTAEGERIFDLVLLAPATIFGEASDTVSFHPYSQQIPFVISEALEKDAVYQIGNGINSWSFVHIDDLTNLYELIVEKLLNGELAKLGYLGCEGYFFAESGFYEWRQAYQIVGKALHSLGVISSPAPKVIDSDDVFVQVYKNLEMKPVIAGNSRVKADKSRKLGWESTKTLDDFLTDIEYLSAVLSKNKQLGQK